MENLVINNTPNTPQVYFNAKNGELSIMGNSTSENPLEYFNPIMKWIEEYAKHPVSATKVKIFMVYFNTVSYKCLLGFFKKLQTISEKGNKVKVFWHYDKEDEDLLETGQDYEDIIIDVPFEFIPETEELQLSSIKEDQWYHLQKKHKRKENRTKIVLVILLITSLSVIGYFIGKLIKHYMSR